MTGTMAYRLACLLEGCDLTWDYVPGTKSAADADESIMQHLQAFPDSGHIIGAPQRFWSAQDWESLPEIDPADLVFVQAFECQSCEFRAQLMEDPDLDTEGEVAALADAHRLDKPSHVIVTVGKSIMREE